MQFKTAITDQTRMNRCILGGDSDVGIGMHKTMNPTGISMGINRQKGFLQEHAQINQHSKNLNLGMQDSFLLKMITGSKPLTSWGFNLDTKR